ncbi:MAG: methyltransferase domain-containing protein [Bacteroidetes bacterium]|nr:methyltransferase domain-containing protein [Bacteroidota bacterium]
MRASEEIQQGKRFSFGKNWSEFLQIVNEERVNESLSSLQKLLMLENLKDKTFLDVGSGNGLFSLAAKKLGSSFIHSFDYDELSVQCTLEMKKKKFPEDLNWKIELGSVLDTNYLKTIPQFDIVYSWGVLHHTGNMKLSFENILSKVKKGGLLCIAIYNDQGIISRFWKLIKRTYCSGFLGRTFVLSVFIPYYTIKFSVIGLLKYGNPIKYFNVYKKNRGMSVYHDWIDWLGGLPFEVAKPETLKKYFEEKGFITTNMIITKGLGCNQFVFKRVL